MLIILSSLILVFVSWKLGIVIDLSSPVSWVLLGLAGARAGRLLSYESIFRPVRARFGLVVEKYAGGAGETEVNRNGGKIGDLLECPICSGTWGILGVLTAYIIYPPFGSLFAIFLGAGAIMEFVSWSTESVEWLRVFIRVQLVK